MTKLLITENLITNKQDFIKLSNISEGVEFITFDDNIINVEGDKPMEGRVILFSFPSAKHADEWYADPEYQELSEHRRASVTTTLTRVSGLPPRK